VLGERRNACPEMPADGRQIWAAIRICPQGRPGPDRLNCSGPLTASLLTAGAPPDWSCWDNRGSFSVESGGARRRAWRHDDAPVHPQDDVCDINVREGAGPGECQSEAMVPARRRPVEQA
jgi:hypothetical protein